MLLLVVLLQIVLLFGLLQVFIDVCTATNSAVMLFSLVLMSCCERFLLTGLMRNFVAGYAAATFVADLVGAVVKIMLMIDLIQVCCSLNSWLPGS